MVVYHLSKTDNTASICQIHSKEMIAISDVLLHGDLLLFVVQEYSQLWRFLVKHLDNIFIPPGVFICRVFEKLSQTLKDEAIEFISKDILSQFTS